MAFKPGESGNPGGRPKKSNAAAIEARKHYMAAINTHIANLGDEDPNVRHKAAEALLDRGFGKPQEYIEIEEQIHAKQVSDDVVFQRLMEYGIDPQLIVKAFSDDEPGES